MDSDPVVAEVRSIRELQAARFGYRLNDIVKEAQRQDATGDRNVVRLPSRRPETSPSIPGQPERSVGADSR